MTPEEAHAFLEEHEGIEIASSDLETHNPQKWRAQFLVSFVGDKEQILKDLDDTEIKYYNTTGSPMNLRHLELPPK